MGIEQLGPYRIGKRIGKGGMGAVYEAVHEETGERAAVKTLAPQLASEEGFRDRFEAEIDSLKTLRHEGIVRLYGYGEQDGTLFYSMELVEGTSLEEELNAGRRFDWRETLQIGTQICQALKHAHDSGVVHRDIKPANILLTANDRVKIADFGIARLFGGTQLTSAGGVLGTADYMSPEQADGSPITERCDQYSLGGVMYALLAGRPPFRAKTMPEMLQLQRYAQPDPVRRYAANTPAELERLLTQLLAKDPEDRFPNVLVLGRHMEAMEKALSRPVQNEAEHAARDTQADSHRTIADDGPSEYSDDTSQTHSATDEVSSELELEGSSGKLSKDIFDAPTMAEQPIGSGVHQPPPQPLSETGDNRFTTIDEETRRQMEISQGSRWGLLLQLAGLTLALACLAWAGWKLTRPATADDLYKEITATIAEEGTDDLRSVAVPLMDFLDRFADDPRVKELTQYHEELLWQRRERGWRLKPNRTNPNEANLSANIYYEAMQISKENPARAAKMLESLLALYPLKPDTEKADGGHNRNQSTLVLAERQLKKLRAKVREQVAASLPELQERFSVARELEKSDPSSARRMYQAIVSLYDDQPWAERVVEDARRHQSE